MKHKNNNTLLITPTVLIVDDDSKNRFALTEILSELKCEVIEAVSGEEALKVALDTPLALILLDVQMPNMDGFEVATLLKKNKKTKEIPIVFITAYSKDQKHIQYGHIIGGADYILKPLDPVVLSSKVNVYLDNYIHKAMLENELENLNIEQDTLFQSKIELEKLANQDFLTGLKNRHSFEDGLKNAIEVAKKNHTMMILMYLDLDNFKNVNDSFGHDIGDKLLKVVSKRIQDVLRSTDIIARSTDEYAFSRLGGDEFSIFFSHIRDRSIGALIASRILDVFNSRTISIDNHKLDIGVSIGIAVYPEAGESFELLCRHADQAMYVAKKSGKNSYCYFSNKSGKS